MEDNDNTGRAHVMEVANALRGIVPDIHIVTFRDLPEHSDLTDWIGLGHGRDDLLAKIEAAKPYHQRPQPLPIRNGMASRYLSWNTPCLTAFRLRTSVYFLVKAVKASLRSSNNSASPTYWNGNGSAASPVRDLPSTLSVRMPNPSCIGA
jgi:hypothetical protein